MNIDSLILSVIFMLIAAGGFVWGYKWGFRRGYKAGRNIPPLPVEPPDIPSPFPFMECRPDVFSCVLKIPMTETPVDRLELATLAAKEISEKIASMLLARRVICPVILRSHIGPRRDTMEVGASIYAAANPTYKQYSRLVFSEPATLDQDNPLGQRSEEI